MVLICSSKAIEFSFKSSLDLINVWVGIFFFLDDLKENSIALLEQMRTIDKSRLIRKKGELTPLEMERINKCIRISLGV